MTFKEWKDAFSDWSLEELERLKETLDKTEDGGLGLEVWRRIANLIKLRKGEIKP